MSTTGPNIQPAFTFIDRITSAQKMGVTEQGGKTVLTPTSLQTSPLYQSPYQLAFDFSWADLVAGFDQAPFNSSTLEGNPDFFHNPPQDWFDLKIYQANHDNPLVGSPCWGPAPRRYAPPPIPSSVQSHVVAWQTQRLIAVAAAMIGYRYHHHHIPDWNPGEDWYELINNPNCSVHSPAIVEYIGQGVDCSDYTSWLYNYGLGIYLNTDTGIQGSMHISKTSGGDIVIDNKTINDNSGKPYTVRAVADARLEYAQLVQKLQPGDLLYIAGDYSLTKDGIRQQLEEGTPPPITHVVMWVGNVGQSSNGVPLVTDSHGSNVLDEKGKPIPNGIQIRPFNNSGPDAGPTAHTDEYSPSWYYNHFLWALRILPDL